MIWQFFLNDIRVWEPLGWDSVQFTIRRSDLYGGMEFSFSDELTFDQNGGEYLALAYELSGIDAEVRIRIEGAECDTETYRYEGVINFAIYKQSGDRVTVGIRQSGFTEAFKNRLDVPVNLDSPTGVAGGTLSAMSPSLIELHSKEIFFLSRFQPNPALSEFNTVQFGAPPGHVPPLQLLSEELEGAMQPTYYAPIPENPVFYSGFEYPAGIATRRIRVRLRLAFEAYLTGPYSTTIGMKSEIYLRPRGGAPYGLQRVLTFNLTNAINSFDTGDLEFVLDLPVDTNIFLHIDKTGNPQPGTTQYKYLNSSYLELSEESTFPASTARVYLVHELLSRITESITGVTDAFRSDFFGRTDSVPHAYKSDGPAGLLAVTSGLSIRNMLDKNGQPYPVTCSFEQAYAALDAVYCLGRRIERETLPDGTEKEFVRVEPREYFYNRTVVKSYPMAEGIERAVALDLLPNEFECGYSKWETEQVNGLDEFNTKRNYVLPLRANKRKFSAVCDFVAGGYAIEFTRRQQFKSSPTTDYKTDNNLFLVCVVRETAGFAAERAGGFEPVIGLFSPQTAYNLRISPGRIAQRWAAVLAASVLRSPDKSMRFQSGTGNYRMTAAGIREDGALMLPAAPLYQGETLSFEYPVNFADFLSLVDSAIFAHQVSCSDTGFVSGFIKEVTYEPNRGGGVAKFKLIRA